MASKQQKLNHFAQLLQDFDFLDGLIRWPFLPPDTLEQYRQNAIERTKHLDRDTVQYIYDAVLKSDSPETEEK